MEAISGMISGSVHSLPAAAGAGEPPEVHHRKDTGQGSPARLAKDEYIPEEKREPTGRYWVERDEDGKPKICFDDPEQAADSSETPDGLSPDGPDKAVDAAGSKKKDSDGRAENCTCNTDQVDREIEKLKREQQELEKQLHSETDDAKIRSLEKRLAQVESELRQKDNDAYRRQHAVFS